MKCAGVKRNVLFSAAVALLCTTLGSPERFVLRRLLFQQTQTESKGTVFNNVDFQIVQAAL